MNPLHIFFSNFAADLLVPRLLFQELTTFKCKHILSLCLQTPLITRGSKHYKEIGNLLRKEKRLLYC